MVLYATLCYDHLEDMSHNLLKYLFDYAPMSSSIAYAVVFQNTRFQDLTQRKLFPPIRCCFLHQGS